jgi:cyclic pyranopterin monophosphate synthase
MSTFSHLDAQGSARMVDVSPKPQTARVAVAEGSICMSHAALALLLKGDIAKGNVLIVAKTAGILAAKRTADLIPLCHPLQLEHIDIEFAVRTNRIDIRASIKLTGRTGAEMEALTAVAIAALTIYDMCKAIDREMEIGGVHLVEKSGGRSGRFERRVAKDASYADAATEPEPSPARRPRSPAQRKAIASTASPTVAEDASKTKGSKPLKPRAGKLRTPRG